MSANFIKAIIDGELWEKVREGIELPTFTDEDIEKDPLLYSKKVEIYHNGRDMFIKTIGIMASALLNAMPYDADGVMLELNFKKKQE